MIRKTLSIVVLPAVAVVQLGVSTLSAQPAEDAPIPMNQDAGGAMEMDMESMQGGSPPPDARDPHAYAEGAEFTMGAARPRLADEMSFGSLLVENLETMRVDGRTSVRYDLEAWFGHTYDRAVLKAEGDIEGGDIAEGRTELLWGHAIASYWDTQVGIRYDSGEGPDRSWAAFGIEGLAPYWFELEVTGYIGESSRTALRIDGSYEMLITQRLVLQPRIEISFYGKSDVDRGLGNGLSDVTAALRLRYEFRRELAPYIGFERVKEYGATEDLTRAAGGDPNDTRVVAGIRFWF